jgi:hypothetical protein
MPRSTAHSRNHLLITILLAPAIEVSHFRPKTGQTCFKNPGFGWRSGEKACSSQAVKTGQFRVRECTLPLLFPCADWVNSGTVVVMVGHLDFRIPK